MKFSSALAFGAVALALAVSAEANAATWDFTYTVQGGPTATGTLVTSNTPNSALTFGTATTGGASNGGVYPGGTISPDAHGYDILSISGTRGSDSIGPLYVNGTTGTLQTYPGYIFDNVLYGSTTSGTNPSFDILGLEYGTAASGYFNVYYSVNGPNGQPGYIENTTPISFLSVVLDPHSAPPSGGNPVSPVPLPPALPLFGAVIAGLGLFGWRRKALASKI